MLSGPIRQAVVLAAGDGDRMGELTRDVPKPLLPVVGRPLVSLTLQGLRGAGIEDVVVVIGYHADRVRDLLGDGRAWGLRVRYAENPDYHAGNLGSLLAARSALAPGAFLLAMADQMLSARLLAALCGAGPQPLPRGGGGVAADFGPWRAEVVDEATRIRTDGAGRVLEIGKGLAEFDALDAGGFVLDGDVWQAASARGGLAPGSELSALMQILADERRLRAVDVSGSPWHDVDTPRDLEVAEAFAAGVRLAVREGRRADGRRN